MNVELKLEVLKSEVFPNSTQFIHNLEILAVLSGWTQIKYPAQDFLTENTCGFGNFFGNY